MLHATIAATVCKIVEIARSKEHLMFLSFGTDQLIFCRQVFFSMKLFFNGRLSNEVNKSF